MQKQLQSALLLQRQLSSLPREASVIAKTAEEVTILENQTVSTSDKLDSKGKSLVCTEEIDIGPSSSGDGGSPGMRGHDLASLLTGQEANLVSSLMHEDPDTHTRHERATDATEEGSEPGDLIAS